MNRKQRRALRGATKGKQRANITKAALDVENAITELGKAGGLDKTLGDLQVTLTNTQQAVQTMLGEQQSLVAELEIQREMVIQLLTILLGPAVQQDLSGWSDSDLVRVRTLEESLRKQYMRQSV